MPHEVPVRYIRLTTKERPTDRFLTVQVREAEETSNEATRGDLYFLVEIHNPWFPNSQIGQTIINTVVREYRRGESTSILVNFELALRKTNQVLAQITQNGETDWIGNLSSLIALVVDGHVHIAQTGKAVVYLVRGGKLSEVTEGLEEEASQHPLTTYTNITTGNLESGDRLMFASSDLPLILSLADLKSLIGDTQPLADISRTLAKNLQKHRLQRIQAFLMEVAPSPDFASETLYIDQPLDSLGDTAKRYLERTIRPGLAHGTTFINQGAQNTQQWTRDWLIPRVVSFTKQAGSILKNQSKKIGSKTQPLLSKTRQAVIDKLPKKTIKEEPDDLANQPLAGATIYRVHHYEERREPKKTKGPKPFWTTFVQGISQQTNQLLKHLQLQRVWTQPRNLLLGAAVVVIIFIALSAVSRRNQQTTEAQQTSAQIALAQAKVAQQSADRSFILDQKESAKTNFLNAIAKAREASENETTRDQALAIINQSQTQLNQLMDATLFEDTSPVMSLAANVHVLSEASGTLATLSDDTTVTLSSLGDTATNQLVTLPTPITTQADSVAIENSTILKTLSTAPIRIDLSAKTAEELQTDGAWETGDILGRFTNNLYILDRTAGQIWKHTPQGSTYRAGQAFLKTAIPELFATAVDLAIDGAMYVLTETGTVLKLTKNGQDTTWQLTGIPTPWDSILEPVAVFADAGANRLFVLENKTDQHPARLLSFELDGTFAHQLLLPTDWLISAAAFDAAAQTGYFAVDTKVYEIIFPSES